MNSVTPNNLSLKYQKFTPSGCKNIGIRKLKFVTKTQFLYKITIQPLFEKQSETYHHIIFKMLKFANFHQFSLHNELK